MVNALITPALLNWAIERSGLEPDEVASRVGVTEERLSHWLQGEKLPTFRQATIFAKAVAVPFGFLYLNEPPVDEVPIPDFRTITGRVSRMDANTRDLLQDIQFKREWFSDFRKRGDFEPLDFVGSFSRTDDTTQIAENIRAVLRRSDDSLFNGNLPWTNFLTRLMLAAEQAGIWIMRSGIVKNNTSRPLNVQSFRWFAISDPILPIVFINGKDATAAQIFTIAHELAHLWLGSTDINTVEIGAETLDADDDLERKCNQIAAEFLTPRNEFVAAWSTEVPLIGQIDSLSRRFSVSRIVTARRAFDLNLIERGEFFEFYRQESARWAERRDSSGGDFYKVIPIRNGRTFTETVVSEAMRGNMLLRDASRLLGIKPAKLKELRV